MLAKPADENVAFLLALKDPSVAGGSVSTITTGSTIKAITTASRRPSGSGRRTRAAASRPAAARVRSTAPTGTTHDVRVGRYRFTRPLSARNQNSAAHAASTNPPAIRAGLQRRGSAPRSLAVARTTTVPLIPRSP